MKRRKIPLWTDNRSDVARWVGIAALVNHLDKKVDHWRARARKAERMMQ